MSSAQGLKNVLAFAHEQFGLVINSHQEEILTPNYQRYLEEKKLDEKILLSQLKNQDEQTTQDIVDLLTIQESYFFRDKSLFYLLEKEFLPALIKQKRITRKKEIKIWSAGCAKGEELYSVAILLSQLLLDLKAWHITLIGTDINKAALKAARRGLYSAMALRATDEEVKKNYFSEENKLYQLADTVKQMATFNYANLTEKSHLAAFFDVIFCRNVFIYFDQEAIDKGLKHFKEALTTKGLLFLGPSDFVRYHQKGFLMHVRQGVTYLTQLSREDFDLDLKEKKVGEIEEEKTTYIHEETRRANQFKALNKMLQNKQFKTALRFLNTEPKLFNASSLLYRYKGEVLIGLGDIATAKAMLVNSLKQDTMDAKSHFLLALVLMGEDNEAAKKALLKAIDIKKAFSEAYYHLALLYLSQHQIKIGLAYLVQAKIYAAEENKATKVIGSDGCMGDLVEVIDEEIAYYQGLSDEK